MKEDKEIVDLLKKFLADDKEAELKLYDKYKKYINNNFLMMIKESFSYDRVSKFNLANDMAKKVSENFWNDLVKSKKINFKSYNPDKTKLINYIVEISEEYYKNYEKKRFNIDLLEWFLADNNEAGWELYNRYKKKIYCNLFNIIKSSFSDERISQSDLAKDMAKKVTWEFWDDLVRKKRKKLKNYDSKEAKLITYIMKMSENYLIDYMKKNYNREVKKDKNKKSTDKIKVRSDSLYNKIKSNNSSDEGTELIDLVVLQNNPYPNPENEGTKRAEILQECSDRKKFTNLNDDEFMNIMGHLIYKCLEEELYNKFKEIVESGYKYVHYIEISLMSMIGFAKDEILSHVRDKEVEINEGNFSQRKHEGWKRIEKILKEFKNNAGDCCNAVFNYENIELTKLFTMKISEWLEEFQNNAEKEKIRKKLNLWLSRY